MSPKTIKVSEDGNTVLFQLSDEAARKASEAIIEITDKKDQSSPIDPDIADELRGLAEKLQPKTKERRL